MKNIEKYEKEISQLVNEGNEMVTEKEYTLEELGITCQTQKDS